MICTAINCLIAVFSLVGKVKMDLLTFKNTVDVSLMEYVFLLMKIRGFKMCICVCIYVYVLLFF